MPQGLRDERQHGPQVDQRSAFQRDRDRIIHTLAFRRLAYVTQVVGPHEGHVFHNRLTHSIEVAQIARRIAERFQGEEGVGEAGGIDPDVVEAAALAHDLGHPPFGHIAEECLNKLALGKDCPDGFEGNAQTFRILTRLAAHSHDYGGLNLTRATLNAVLKYPWSKSAAPSEQPTKYGFYDDDRLSFAFARDETDHSRSLEAEIMDFADDLAYSVHDFDDFYRAGLIPLELLKPTRVDRPPQEGQPDVSERDSVRDTEEYTRVVGRWVTDGKATAEEAGQERDSIVQLLKLVGSESRYEGRLEQRVERRQASAFLIRRYVQAVSLDLNAPPGRRIKIDASMKIHLSFLRNLIWCYLIKHPRLATQQAGQLKIIETLFEFYLDSIGTGKWDRIPPRFQGAARNTQEDREKARLVADVVASFTDSQAVSMYRRVLGVDAGSVLDLLER